MQVKRNFRILKRYKLTLTYDSFMITILKRAYIQFFFKYVIIGLSRTVNKTLMLNFTMTYVFNNEP